jgi:agmatine deiminase
MPPDANNLYPNNSNADYRTFTNSVFVNKTIILPFYETKYDTTATRIYEEALPGYKVVGIDCNSIIPSLGAIHCITKEIAAKDPLLISHQPLHDTYNTTTPYTVTARIQHASGIQQAYIYYTTDTAQPWQSVSMINTGGYNWSGDIPAQGSGSTIYYYIEGRSVSGKTQVRPMPAPSGFWKFKVLINLSISTNSSVKIDFTGTFPNPSHGITCIPVVTPDNTAISISLKNVLGQTVIPVFNGINNGEKKYFMNTSSTAPGVYLLEMLTKDSRDSQTIIVR